MAKVDVADDSIRRFVVHHYRYDPMRHERRHVVVDAFDNEAEFMACMESLHDDIERRRLAGEWIDRNEHCSGMVYEPGDRRRAATGHLISSMMAHGVDPRPYIDMDDLPSNIAFLSADEGRGARLRRARRVIRRWLSQVGRR